MTGDAIFCASLPSSRQRRFFTLLTVDTKMALTSLISDRSSVRRFDETMPACSNKSIQ